MAHWFPLHFPRLSIVSCFKPSVWCIYRHTYVHYSALYIIVESNLINNWIFGHLGQQKQWGGIADILKIRSQYFTHDNDDITIQANHNPNLCLQRHFTLTFLLLKRSKKADILVKKVKRPLPCFCKKTFFLTVPSWSFLFTLGLSQRVCCSNKGAVLSRGPKTLSYTELRIRVPA